MGQVQWKDLMAGFDGRVRWDRFDGRVRWDGFDGRI